MGILGTTPSSASIALSFVRTRAPAATDDIANGYAEGAHWTDTATNRLYICVEHEAGAAVWKEVDPVTVPPPPPPPSTSLKRGIAYFVQGGQDFTDTSIYPYIALAILEGTQIGNLQAYKNWRAGQAPPHGKAVFYKTLTETASVFGVTPFTSVTAQQSTPQANRFASTCLVPAEEVKYHDANFPADQWMLYNASGQAIYYGGYSQSWLVHAASASYQQLAYQYARGQIISQGWDGIYWDNILVTDGFANASFPLYRKNSAGALVVAYADHAAWENGIVSCLQGVSQQLRNDGFFVPANTHWYQSGNGASDNGLGVAAWWTKVGPYVDAMLAEYGVITGGGHRSEDNAAWYDFWLNWTKGLKDVATSKNSGMMSGIGGSVASEYDARYSTGSWLVNWDGEPTIMGTAVKDALGTAFFPAVHMKDWSQPPIGAKMQSNNLRARRFTWGWAVVNTTRAGSRTATFTDPVTNQPRTFTVGPVDAYIGA